jgi:NifU-like protein involved in Fe-S cluster formation
MSEAAKIKALYNARIMEFAENIPREGRLDAPDATASVRSPLCGSLITVDIKVQDGVIAGYAHVVRACTLGQAAASITARHIIGTTVAEFHHIAAAMRAMLKEGQDLPAGAWEDLQVLTPVRDFKSRHGSVLLSFDAVEKALAQIEATGA